MSINEMRKKAYEQNEIDKLITEINTKFASLFHTYRAYTLKVLGRSVSLYDKDYDILKNIIKFDNIKMKVVSHGFTKACFLTYRKGIFKKKEFYHAMGYSFFTEYNEDTRYKFSKYDYKLIINDLDRAIKRIKETKTPT